MTLPSLGRIVRPVVALGLTGYVLWRAHPAAVVEVAARANLWWIAAAVGLAIADRVLMAYRWVVLLCPIEPSQRPPLGPLMRLFFVSTFVGTFLPASVGGDIVRAYGLSRLKVGKGAAIASVLLDRLLGVISILVVAAIGLWLAGRSDLLSSRAVWVSLLTATATSALGSAVIFSERAAAATRRLARRLPGHMTRGLADELTDATRAYARFHRQLGNVLIGSLAVQVLRIVGAYCLGRALNINASLGVYFAFIPIILLVMLLPISINGIGPSQLAFVWLFGLAATPAAEAFALSILFVGLGVVGNLPGGILYVWQPTPRAIGS